MTPVLCTPLVVERAAVARAAPALRVVRTGMGPRRARAAAARLRAGEAPLLVAGTGGGTTERVRPGELVVATELIGEGAQMPARLPARLPLPSAPLLASAISRLGLTVHTGPIACSARIVEGERRVALGATGALAVDTESIQLAEAAAGAPLAVVRSVVDTPDRPLWRAGTAVRGMAALWSLRACVPALRQWAAATGTREVTLADRSPAGSDLVLVAGSRDAQPVVDAAERNGTPAYLVADVADVDLRWLAGVHRLGIVAGASQRLVHELVHCLGGLGPTTVRQSRPIDEDNPATLPREVS